MNEFLRVLQGQAATVLLSEDISVLLRVLGLAAADAQAHVRRTYEASLTAETETASRLRRRLIRMRDAENLFAALSVMVKDD